MSEFQITKKLIDYSIRKSANWGVYLIRGTFDLQNGMFWPWGLIGSIAKVLTDFHEKIWQKLCWFSGSPKSPCIYSTRILAKLGVYLLWGIFDLQKETFYPWRLTGSIAKVLTDVHEKFWQKWGRNSRSPKSPWTIAHDNRQNGRFTWSGEHLTFKMGCFGRDS